jgi:heat shock protein 4
VISCPGWYTDRKRRVMLDAASIANLKFLRLMNDLTAAALGYGITKTDLPDHSVNSTAEPRIVCFFDIGHSSMQVSIVSIVKGKVCDSA